MIAAESTSKPLPLAGVSLCLRGSKWAGRLKLVDEGYGSDPIYQLWLHGQKKADGLPTAKRQSLQRNWGFMARITPWLLALLAKTFREAAKLSDLLGFALPARNEGFAAGWML